MNRFNFNEIDLFEGKFIFQEPVFEDQLYFNDDLFIFTVSQRTLHYLIYNKDKYTGISHNEL